MQWLHQAIHLALILLVSLAGADASASTPGYIEAGTADRCIEIGPDSSGLAAVQAGAFLGDGELARDCPEHHCVQPTGMTSADRTTAVPATSVVLPTVSWPPASPPVDGPYRPPWL